ncbi:cyanidin 3-O-rutinoside 5-O-glucosyltransferase [Brachypodium distachyon]|uniref:Glycosyltransferase n=1 Tax=Brachypodium distachyon TaxID=15368 RepID=A0A0Q3PS50_BRADI|nr:cyanidin 3-O-rutinoside 5-O-glucosyltransferase [Brachypodium distachyon]KQJ92337.1 hypothetical protein BRADI_4g42997v3 [Brachypodium distachyon]|eukprot:XP_024311125.1 cyanidin 3-O-rutinoside 5-O-glucosyltransferase [Brachypodium distachyon]
MSPSMAAVNAELQQQHGGSPPHFLVVAYGIQSHINPCRLLAHRLACLGIVSGSGPVLATLAVPLSAHRRMFPNHPSGNTADSDSDGVISYAPYSDGLDDGSPMPRDAEGKARVRRASFEGLSSVVASLAALGRPVTCVVVSMVHPAALDVARATALPLAVFWIQPATVLAAYYHFFHDDGGHYKELVTSHAADPDFEVSIPGLSLRRRPLRIRDFPTFLVDTTGSDIASSVNEALRELFEFMDQQGKNNAKVLVNTMEELEPSAVAAMAEHLDLFPVGPVVASGSSNNNASRNIHLFDHDNKAQYISWLDAQPASSVIYVSFGSIWTYSKPQMEEIAAGLKQCNRPFLLVVRKDGRQDQDVSSCLDELCAQELGIVVAWCDQAAVLAHPAVGCFVTHCGWNSTLEAAAHGVPVVAAPGMFDQPTNAFLAEQEWGAGVRVEKEKEDEGGVFAGAELARCVQVVMGDGGRGMEIRGRAQALKEIARKAAADGGPAEKSLRNFVMAVVGQGSSSDNSNTSKLVEADVVEKLKGLEVSTGSSNGNVTSEVV